jgi:hypothetical protein
MQQAQALQQQFGMHQQALAKCKAETAKAKEEADAAKAKAAAAAANNGGAGGSGSGSGKGGKSGSGDDGIMKSGNIQRVAILAAQTDSQPILAEHLAELG